MRPGDVLRDADGPAARVIRVRPAGRARTVHNIEVDTTHAYYVATTTGTWTLAHNGCTWDDAAGGWVDTETGEPRTPTRFSELVSSKGRINYDDVDRLATQNGLTNRFLAPQNLDSSSQRFLDGGFQVRPRRGDCLGPRTRHRYRPLPVRVQYSDYEHLQTHDSQQHRSKTV